MWLVSLSCLYGAADYRWLVNKPSVELREHEAVEIHYSCIFKDSGALYAIELNPVRETEMYRLEVLSAREKIDDGIRRNDYRYVLFAKKSGSVTIEPDVLMRKTTRASIEETVIGRDNVEDIVYTDTRLKLPRVDIDVLPADASYTGSFDLNVNVSPTSVKAYEPVHVTVRISGQGNLDRFKPYELNISGVNTFVEAPQSDYELTEDGYRGGIVQKFALVGDKDFVIPALTLNYFDLGQKQVRTLKSVPYPVSVEPLKQRDELLDDVDGGNGFTWRWAYLYYLLTFIAGFIAGRLLQSGRDEESQGPVTLKEQFQRCRDIKQLLTIAAIHDDGRFGTVIARYERESNAALKQAKNELMEIADEGVVR
jgi:hypothetical protein